MKAATVLTVCLSGSGFIVLSKESDVLLVLNTRDSGHQAQSSWKITSVSHDIHLEFKKLSSLPLDLSNPANNLTRERLRIVTDVTYASR